ncbi:PorP/SprF family type IX secretion system membrane protein [Pedobacter nutrimenti]|jgi:type IX secretion system PorP/SprF family membrane protein|uniref:Type IX secretion system PorP/SprF family membrane protein n=1 Tax=Pedobacter nutrimenti TaxID=1241337 RepID=A0A318U7P2_9SPHI|nr:PorP/SprF family type IX secretion system membrane protein [Pedobacter nutrimenti]PYF70026.1 type IX secretion system PorP/SprF family membrane protein [Pedobacter nutrimenti]|eukprot:gene4857-5646_t
MEKLGKIIAIGFIFSLCIFKVSAQIDPHFSQYYANPLWLNPGLTGVTDGEYRFNLNVKQQWGSLSNGYLTGGASFDMAPVKNFAFGAMILNQNAGDISYNNLSALVSGAYRIRFGQEGTNIINFGIQAGILNRSFDVSKITTGSQFNPVTGYDGSVLINENFSAHNTLVPDVNAGAMYFDGSPDQTINTFLGVSVNHLTRPVDKFLGSNVKMPMRYTAHGGARIKVSDILDITPNGIYMKQGNSREIAAGAYAQMMLNNESDLMFGANYRVDDAAIAFFGLHIKNMVFGLSYDFNTSSLNRATGSKGGLELSISFTSKKGISGPNFFCPRL